MVTTVGLYEGLFSQVSFARVAKRVKQIQDAPAIAAGGAGYMGGPILSNIRRRNSPVFPQDRDGGLIDKRLLDLQLRDDKAVRARALNPLQRANSEIERLTLPAIVFPNGGRVPQLQGNPDEKRAQALQFLETNLDVKIKELYSGSMFVIEAVPEKVEIKQALFEFLAYILPEDAILATNTSSLSIDEIARNIPHSERVVGIHYFDPADQNQLAEVILGTKTSPEVAVTAYNLLQLEGKKPIICFKDAPLAIANRILVGVLNHAARLADKGIAPRDLIDEIFIQTFYPEQVDIKLSAAQKQFEKAPKLAKFKDEASTYRKIDEIERKANILLEKSKFEEREKLFNEKIALLKQAQAELNQKVLYAGIVENAKVLGTFFEAAPSVLEIKRLAQERLTIINQYLSAIEESPVLKTRTIEQVTGKELKPYLIADSSNDRSSKTRKLVQDHLVGAYISISQKIAEELATVSDIELACTEGFQYNYGPSTIAEKYGTEEVQRLFDLVNVGHTKEASGISSTYTKATEEDLSGVQTFVQDDVGHIVFGRNHVQSLSMTANSLNPPALRAILKALEKFEGNPDVKTIFFESKGGKTFGSGADLAYVQTILNDTIALKDFLGLGNEVMDRLEKCSKPTVGFADGTWAGGMGELLAACSYRFGTVDASGTMPENALGLFQAWGGIKRFPKLIGKELTLPFFCNSQGTKFAWMTADEACRAGFFDNKKPFLRSDLVKFKADLIAGNIEGIDIRKPNNRQAAFDKQVDDYDIRKKFNLGKLDKPNQYKHKRSPLAWEIRRFTEKLIRNSDKPEELQKIMDSMNPERLVEGIQRVQELYFNPQLWLAQNTVAARIAEFAGASIAKILKVKKTLFG